MKTQTLTIDIANPHFTKVITSRINDKNGLKLTVLLKDGGYPCNLSGYTIKYEAGSNLGSFIRDDCKIIDASNGVFEYIFSAAAVSASVWVAYFAFEKGEERFTTQDIKVVLSRDVKQGNINIDNYISDFEKALESVAGYRKEIDDTNKKIVEAQNKVAELTTLINDKGVQIPKITTDKGAATISVSETSKNILDEIANKGVGMNTIYCSGTVQNGNIPSKMSWRGISFLNAPQFGFVIAKDYKGAFFTNYYNGTYGWTGWEEHANMKDVAKVATDLVKVTTDLTNAQNAINKINTDISSMTDPLFQLNKVNVIAKIPFWQMIEGSKCWLQGLNIKDETGEIFANYQDYGTIARIDKFDYTGKPLATRRYTIEPNSYTESLPYFETDSGTGKQTNFIVRTKADSSYRILNFETGTITSSYMLKGRRTLGVRDGEQFYTYEEDSSGRIVKMYIYKWSDITKGTPGTPIEKDIQTTKDPFEKTQGIAVNSGYTFLMQGAENTRPGLSVIDSLGQLKDAVRYTKSSLRTAIRKKFPNDIPDVNAWVYETEGGCTYKGKLITVHCTTDDSYLVMHNVATGTDLEVEITNVIPMGASSEKSVSVFWTNVKNSYSAGDYRTLKHATKPNYTQGDNPATFDGTSYTINETGMYTIEAFMEGTIAWDKGQIILYLHFPAGDVSPIASTRNGFPGMTGRVGGVYTWYFTKGQKIKVSVWHDDNTAFVANETRVAIKRI
ncbi:MULTISPECIES: BppU family phage baseplate upper protein [unclassified Bacillus (in: firmicutes)]|uniref:BppU family phage baseplate upper protein n=1 Tax=unclassified Bacillus (in: firmicutes) TaxID=185979 RepID=UPI002814D93A|nr:MULTISPECIES: BppU family phage baseplate upper protein [unclassified Bacillus (in: firmicutes)]